MRADAIRTARVPGRLAGAPRLRPALERWLAEGDLAWYGFPPRAIVVVRRLSARWPDIASDDRIVRYAALAAVLGEARRPARDERGAEVVWFEDEAELLACLARDVLSGALITRWWWRLLLGGAAPRDAVVARWLEAPRVAPRALQRLDRPGARAWIASLTPCEQVSLLRGLAQAFPIAVPVVAYVEDGTLPPDTAPTIRPAPAPLRVLEDVAVSRGERLWLLCHDLAENAMAATEAGHVRRMASRLAAAPPSLSRALPAMNASATLAIETPSLPSSRVAPRAASDGVAAKFRRSGRSAASRAAAPAVRLTSTDALPLETPTHLDGDEMPWPASTDGSGLGAAGVVPVARSLAWLETRYGGLLFLLNAALHLSLYGDFSRPMQRGLPCTPWRFLLEAGRAWCGGDWRTDPLAAWLTRRDRGDRIEGEPIDDDWCLPPPWLAPFAEMGGAWHAIWRGGRLRLVHPADFTVLDTAATPEQCAVLAATEMDRLGIVSPPPVRHVVVPWRAGSARRRAAGHRHGCPSALWPYLRARLSLALGLADGPRVTRRLARVLLRLPARLEDGGDRVDVHVPLEALPLAVRLAGLDRDPGRIPAAGCDVRFHFH